MYANLLKADHPFVWELRRKLNRLMPGLHAQPRLAELLDDDQASELVEFLLKFACQCKSPFKTYLGQTFLLSLPRRWLLDRVQHAAEPLVELQDSWEFDRLLQLYCQLHKPYARQLAKRGQAMAKPRIQLVSERFLLDLHVLMDSQV